MCRYGYYHFQSCGHFGIEVISDCRQSRFWGGWTGSLILCRPDLFCDSTPNDAWDQLLPEFEWESIPGWCRECVDEYMLAPTAYIPSREYKKYPGFNMNEEGPYLYCEATRATIPELLAADSSFIETCQDQGLKILFPKRLEIGTWAEMAASLPWTNQGMWSSPAEKGLSVREAHQDLRLRFGISEWDRQAFQYLKETCGPTKYNIWVETCARYLMERGMPADLCRALLQSSIFQDDNPLEDAPDHEILRPGREARIGSGDGSEDRRTISISAIHSK